ncbi:MULTISPECIES: hypothetical protein [unclassified Bradyrhizobium]|uniref:hypothetical protein n=1 Tax=unclassified Bradyrhizobium TaxID=2631580 RepID=UPI0028E6BC48|nr:MULTISPECIES: hypothetical protein [unclassified Bradyrhizobium]
MTAMDWPGPVPAGQIDARWPHDGLAESRKIAPKILAPTGEFRPHFQRVARCKAAGQKIFYFRFSEIVLSYA